MLNRDMETTANTALADALCSAGTGTYPVARALRDAASLYRTRHDEAVTRDGEGCEDAHMFNRMANDADEAASKIEASADAWYARSIAE